MKLTFLGTAGCTGIPSMYCDCPVCKNARKVKGKEIRTRSGFILDEKVAIDFSADSYCNMTKHDVLFGKIKHLLITHSHEDHYYPQDLALRVTSIRKTSPEIEKVLNVYGNEKVISLFREVSFFSDRVLQTVNLVKIEKNQTFFMDDYKVTSFYVNHMPKEDSLIYLIERNGQSYLHLLDSPEPSQEIYDYLYNNNVRLDAVTADCTYCTMKEEFGGHMQLWQNVRVKNKLTELNVLKPSAKYFLTHFSDYNGIDTYETMKKAAEPYGLTVAYDGLKVEF